jgi:hypothetical protein
MTKFKPFITIKEKIVTKSAIFQSLLTEVEGTPAQAVSIPKNLPLPSFFIHYKTEQIRG